MKGVKVLLAISGVLALAVGGALLLAPLRFLASQGIAAGDQAAVVAQAQGAVLASLGVANLVRGIGPVGLGPVLAGKGSWRPSGNATAS